MEIKNGDYLYCHTTGHMENGLIFAYAGKRYRITKWYGVESFEIDSEFSSNHGWSTTYPKFFEHFSFEKSTDYSYRGSKIKFNFI